MTTASERDAMPTASTSRAPSVRGIASRPRVQREALRDGERSRLLTPEQDARTVRALALFKAKRDAFVAGVPLEQLDVDVWVVDVDAVHAEVA